MRPFLPAIALASACTGASNDIEFAGEVSVLDDFAFDTGLQPSSGPVQIQLTLSGAGTLAARAEAVAGGEGAALAVAAVPGSGTYSLDAHFQAIGMLHVDVSGMTYDGPIPGIENLDIAFGGETTFDPFLMDGAATVTAMLPETKLPNIPLPGGLPGHLELTIATGSTMTSELAGTCATFEGTTATFTTTTRTNATIKLASKIVLAVPVVGDQDFPLPTIDIPVPAFSVPMDLGAREFAGGGVAPTGTLAAPGGCGKGDGPDDPETPEGPGGGGGEVCEAVEGAYDPHTHFGYPVRQDRCTDNALGQFATACNSATSTTQSCQAFRNANLDCFQCLVTDTTANHIILNYPHGPIVNYRSFRVYNLPGCLADVAPGEKQCAENIQKANACLDEACSGCAGSSDQETTECLAAASVGACDVEVQDANNCHDRISNTNTPGRECYTTFDYERRFCGS